MAESFLLLDASEQSKIYRALAPRLSRSAVVLEKDVWVCWVLRTLFTLPGRLPMAFKGGTSLSKVFNAINRFSEDVDVTLDYRGFGGSFDPLAEGASKTQLKKLGEALKSAVRDYVHGVIAPHFREQAEEAFGAGRCRIDVDESGEQFRFYYASALAEPAAYVRDSVLVEFGGRNITEPNEEHEVRPDIAPHIPALDFPTARVQVLSPARTFWEKATLMHVECHRGAFRATVSRLSRHWYDLAMLTESPLGQEALSRRDLLTDVVRHKKIFYNTSYANYDNCLVGRMRLLPDEPALDALGEDYRRMVDAGMFIGKPPSFTAVIERLRMLETSINHAVS